jgi:DNA (cytosine-5)-methyltransferase 1
MISPRLVYDEFSGSFTQIDDARLNREARAARDDPPNSCPVCSLVASQNQGAVPEATRLGVRLRGVDYHLWDFVFYHEDNGPCEIGYIIDVQWKLNRLESSATVHVKRVGRISSLSQILPLQEIRDEVVGLVVPTQRATDMHLQRHLFMTDEITVIPVTKLIRVCYVWPAENIRDPAWLSMSPDHFYIRYQFESLNPLYWEEKQPLNPLKLCEMCTRAKVAEKALMSEFLESSAQRPLRTLDLFAGSGAFGLAMAESRCIKVTHAVEISPSAAKTLR